MTMNTVLKYAGEGETGSIVQADQQGKEGYWQLVREYDWVDDEPVSQGWKLEWLSGDLAQALSLCRHPWWKLRGVQVAPEAREIVEAALQGHEVRWADWFEGAEQASGIADPVLTPYAVEALDFLTEEGFRPRVDSDGDVYFNYEGERYVLTTSTDDPTYLKVTSYGAWLIESEAERQQVLRAVTQAMNRVRVGRFEVGEEWVNGQVTAYLPGNRAYQDVLLKSIDGLRYLIRMFREEMHAAQTN